MAFGLVNSGQTYAKMMRKLLKHESNVDNFVDDVIAHTEDWKVHISTLDRLFQLISDAGLTVKPSKCYFGYTDVEFIGHRVVEGMLLPQSDKVEKIMQALPPVNKKQLRSFLGLANYYRKFVPAFAELVLPLTELTKKSTPNKLPWSENHQKAFERIKQALSSNPILKLPDVSKPFVLQTDASATGIGGILLQQYGQKLFPVAFISKKLLPRECNYATVERECLAIVWAINKLQVYLHGRKFTLQTDQRSLAYLHESKHLNPRLMRWALSLQPYQFKIEAIKGRDNVGADYLSRL
jgi:hypothetical protein